MYHFAVVALLALATLKVVDLLEELVPALARIHTLFTLALAVGAVIAIDYSLFDGFGIDLRERWMGVWATGFVVGSMTTVWRAALAWLGLVDDRAGDRGTTSRSRPRVAA